MTIDLCSTSVLQNNVTLIKNILYSKEFPTNAFFDKGKIISLGTFYANFHSCYRDYNGFIIEY